MLQKQQSLTQAFMRGKSLETSFDGNDSTNVTSYHALNDTRYAVCTTVKYDYKPVMNSTVLRVSPPSIEATQPTKTPEQMQAEAEQRSSSHRTRSADYF